MLQKVEYMVRSTSSRRVATDFRFFAIEEHCEVGGDVFYLVLCVERESRKREENGIRYDI